MRHGFGHHMHGWGGGPLAMVVVLVLIAAVVIGVVWLIVAGPRRSGTDRVRGDASKPEQILAERLARGEIDVDEYRLRLAALRERSPRT